MFGWPSLVHNCKTCGHDTAVEYSATVWTQEHACNHCGDHAAGADIAGQTKAKMNFSQQDELAQLFAQSMQLSGQAPLLQQQSVDPIQVEQAPMLPSKQHVDEHQPPPIHYVSTHYTPTAHIRFGDSHSEPSRSPPPPYLDAVMPYAMSDSLRQNSIDPHSLSPNQIQLFVNADYDQRLRLMELWRIAPPTYRAQDQHGTYDGHSTSLVQEEAEAKLRYEAQMQQPRTLPSVSVENNSTTDSTWWPPAARHRAASIASAGANTRGTDAAEPYMLHGYAEQLGQTQHVSSISPTASDPVYAANASGLWNQASSLGNAQQLEQHYYDQIRNHADWERLNALAMQERLGMMGSVGRDDEMVM